MGFKQLIFIFVLLVFIAAFIVGQSDKIASKLQEYADKNYIEKNIPLHEKISFFNIEYCYWTAKYEFGLALIEKYLERYNLEENREKAQYIKAKYYDAMLDSRKASEEYKKFFEEFPFSKKAEKAKQRYMEIKSYL
jgi:outer membrane protein assembly factor BamD (BamD/ComL family)